VLEEPEDLDELGVHEGVAMERLVAQDEVEDNSFEEVIEDVTVDPDG
jgi:hypothetical protein